MDQTFLDRLARQTEDLKGAGPLQAGARARLAAAAGRAARRRPRTASTSAPTTTSASPTTRRSARRRTARSTATATAWPRCASSAARRPCTRSSRRALSAFLGTDDTILYSSCFDANGGLFETLLGEQDAVISDALNHATIIDGIRLCKAQRLRYANDDMAELETRLQGGRGRARQADRHRRRVLDGRRHRRPAGHLRPRRPLRRAGDGRRLARRSASSAQGGRGTPEHRGVMGRVDILTGTLGKALGGASGGYTSARREIVALLRQRSRPYLFSNSAAAGHRRDHAARARPASKTGDELRAQLRAQHARTSARRMTAAGFTHRAGRAPDRPGDARRRGARRAVRRAAARATAST